ATSSRRFAGSAKSKSWGVGDDPRGGDGRGRARRRRDPARSRAARRVAQEAHREVVVVVRQPVVEQAHPGASADVVGARAAARRVPHRYGDVQRLEGVDRGADRLVYAGRSSWAISAYDRIMNTVPSPPARPNPAARPLLALDRDELRLCSPRGDAVSGFMTLTNRGEAPLEGTILARVGGEWLRIEPAVVRLAPGEARRVEVQADPAGLAPGYMRGELEIITSGGTATIPVRIGVHVRRSWRLLALAVAAGVGVVVAAVLLLA